MPVKTKPKQGTTITIEGATEKHIFTLPDEGFSGLGALNTAPGIPDLPTGMRATPQLPTYSQDGMIAQQVPTGLQSQYGKYFLTNRLGENAGLLSQMGTSPEMIKQAQSFQPQPQQPRDIAKEAYEDGLNRVSRGDWTLDRFNTWGEARFTKGVWDRLKGGGTVESKSKGDIYNAAERMMTENPELSFTDAYILAKRTTATEEGEKAYSTAKGKGKAAFELNFPKMRNTIDALDKQWSLVDTTIDEAINMVSPYTAGVGAWLKVIPATPQKDLAEKLESIKANIGFDKLQQMRADSPTGGALGQVSDFENKLLQAVKGSMAQEQSASQLKKTLERIKNDLQNLREAKRGAYLSDYGNFITQPATQQGNVTKSGNRFTIEEVR